MCYMYWSYGGCFDKIYEEAVQCISASKSDIWGVVACDSSGIQVVQCGTIEEATQEGGVIGVMQQCLEKVGDNRLVGISEVNTIGTDVYSGRVNDAGCISVITLQGDKSSSRECTFQEFG